MGAQPQQIPLRHVVVAAALGWGLSVAAFVAAELHERDETAEDFQRIARYRASIVARSIAEKVDGLHAVRAFIDASDPVEAQQFRDFVKRAYRAHADVEVFEWIPRARGRRQPTDGERGEPSAGFGVARRRKGVPAVLYREPSGSQLSALGPDPAANAAARRLLRTARRRGTLTVGRALTPNGGDGEARTVALAVYDRGVSPGSRVRRKSLRGFVTRTFRLHPVLDEAPEDAATSTLDAYIFDLSEADPRLLYFRAARTRNESFTGETDYRQLQAEWRHTTIMPIANHKWAMVFTPSPQFLEMRKEKWQWAVLVMGFMLTAMVVRQLYENRRRNVSVLAANERLERAQAELSERERDLREIIDSVPHMIFATDADGRFVLANATLAKVYDSTVDGLVGRRLADVHAVPDEARALLAADQAVLQTGEAARADDASFTDARGCKHTLEISRLPYGARATPAVLAVCVDVTERNAAEERRARLEEELRVAQKMESLGSLAGGIAHEFNNLLGAIIGYSELALGRLDGNDRVASYLRQVLGAGDDASKLVKQILAFSRKDAGSPGPVVVAPMVDQALALLKASIPAMIEIRCTIDREAGTVIADATQVEQIVLNLCTNASHAIGDRTGILEVSLERIDVDADLVRSVAGLRVGPYVRLRVADSGCGMDPDTVARIFEPFFTTKPVGEGTGMGLAVVHGIVANHRGAISVTSTRGVGTTFDIYLPRVEDSRASASTRVVRRPASGEHVLLVDDEPALANVARLMLEDLGYRVTALQGSLDALAAFRSDPSAFNAVITDQAMPGMSGTDLASELMRLRPGIPIILATGYSREITAARAQEMGLRGYVSKPYRAADLDAALQAVLHEPAGGEA